MLHRHFESKPAHCIALLQGSRSELIVAARERFDPGLDHPGVPRALPAAALVRGQGRDRVGRRRSGMTHRSWPAARVRAMRRARPDAAAR